METNEQGLTKEEKIMFGILGIILIVAVGVLIFNSFTKNERKLKEETPISETKGQKDEKTEDETTKNNQKENLIEETPVEEVYVNTVVNSQPSPQPTPTIVIPPVPEVEETPIVPGIIEWSFKNTIVTEAYSNDIVKIERNVLLTDGSEVEAAVSLRKLELDTWNLVDISLNEIVVTEGLYKYYYTYGNQTKELLLIVKNRLNIEQLNILTVNDEYLEEFEITEEEFNNYKNNTFNSTIIKEENYYTLKFNKVDDSLPIVPIVVKITEELNNPTITSNTLGIIPSIECKSWYQELTLKDIILWVDLSVLNLDNKEINININDTDYYFDLTTIINEIPKEDNQENQDNQTEEDESNNESSEQEQNPEEKQEQSEKVEEQENKETSDEQENLPEEEPQLEEPTNEEITLSEEGNLPENNEVDNTEEILNNECWRSSVII